MKKHLPFLTLLLALGLIGRFAMPAIDAQVTIANNAAEMSSKIVMLADGGTARTVTNLFTFSRGGATPFSVASGSAAVPNLLNWSEITITTTGTQNNFAPGLAGNTIVRCNNGAGTVLTVTGLSGGIDGQQAIFAMNGSGRVDFLHANGGSSAGNQLLNYVSSAATSIVANQGMGFAWYRFSTTQNKWVLIQHNQGAWITPTYAGTDWTASAGTWTVDPGDIIADKYFLSGRTLYFQTTVAATSVSVTPATLSRNAYGFSAAIRTDGSLYASDAGGANAGATWIISASGSVLSFAKFTGNWTAAANNTVIVAQGFFEPT